MNEPVIPERFKGVYSDLQEHFAECRSDEVERDWPTSLCAKAIEQLGAAEAKVAELERIIAEPWEHTDHWRNPETGYVECECCCKWALDAERDHKTIGEQAATIKRMTAILKELQPMVRRRTGCTLRNRIDAALSKQEPPA